MFAFAFWKLKEVTIYLLVLPYTLFLVIKKTLLERFREATNT